MADAKLPTRHSPSLPSILKDVTSSDHLPSGNAWFGPLAGVFGRNKRVVDSSTAYLRSRQAQSEAYAGLLDARIRIARKFAEVADLPNLLAEEQRQREHSRAVADRRRSLDVLNIAHDLHLAVARHAVELAKTREQGVRALRNLEAAQRVKDAEIDSWYAQATARRNEAEATRQDTEADLHRNHSTTSPDVLRAAMAEELARAIATIDNEIELAKARGNASAVLTLQNVRARLKAAA